MLKKEKMKQRSWNMKEIKIMEYFYKSYNYKLQFIIIIYIIQLNNILISSYIIWEWTYITEIILSVFERRNLKRVKYLLILHKQICKEVKRYYYWMSFYFTEN